MKQNNTFKIALLMALVAGEAFAATTQSRPPRKPIASVRKSGQPSASRQKINPGVQSQKTNTTKQDVVNVVKQFMRNQATPQNLNRLDTFLAKLSQDDLKTLNIKGIKNEKDANNMVWKVKKLADKAPKKPGDNKVEDLGGEKKIKDLLKQIEQLTNDKDDLTKKLEELKKTGTSGSSDDKDKKIEELEGEIAEKDQEISALKVKFGKISDLFSKFFADSKPLSGQSAKLVTALTDLLDVTKAKMDKDKLIKGNLDNLLQALTFAGGLSDIKELGALKDAAEKADTFAVDSNDGVAKFATALEKFLGASFLDGKPGTKLGQVLEYLKAATSEDAARKVDNLKTLLGNDIQVYQVNTRGQLMKGADRQKKNGGELALTDLLKGKKIIVVEGGDNKIVKGSVAGWVDVPAAQQLD
jgi:hypothetical protein